MKNKTKLLINFFGVPGSGKSTMAARLFADLKMRDLDVELVREYAKELVWEGLDLSEITQLEISLEQIRRTEILLDKVSIIITDSPVLVGMLYAEENENLAKSYMKNHHLAMSQHCVNFNVLVKNAGTYNPNGRTQTFEEAQDLSYKLLEILDYHGVSFMTSDKKNYGEVLKLLGGYLE